MGTYGNRWNSRYGARVGYTTRRFSGRFRTVSKPVYSRYTRRRFAGAYTKKQIRNIALAAAEQKFLNTLLPGDPTPLFTISAGGVIIDCSAVTQGTADTQRIGDKLTVNSFEVKWMWTWTTRTVDTGTGIPIFNENSHACVRAIFFKWYDDTNPTVTDILDTSSAGAVAGFYAPHLSYNHDKKVKRKVFMDKVQQLTSQIVYDYQNVDMVKFPAHRAMGNEYIDLKKKSMKVRVINYQGGTTTGVGKFYLLLISDQIVLHGPACLYNVRLNFTDA